MSDRGRLTDEQAAAVLANARPLDRPAGASPRAVRPFTAQRLSGGDLVVSPSPMHRQLFLFLSESCEGCRDLFEASASPDLFGLESHDELYVLLREPLRGDWDATSSWLISNEAFASFEVTSAPFFVLVDPAFTTVATEGVAWGTASVRSAIQKAASGSPEVEVVHLDGPLP